MTQGSPQKIPRTISEHILRLEILPFDFAASTLILICYLSTVSFSNAAMLYSGRIMQYKYLRTPLMGKDDYRIISIDVPIIGEHVLTQLLFISLLFFLLIPLVSYHFHYDSAVCFSYSRGKAFSIVILKSNGLRRSCHATVGRIHGLMMMRSLLRTTA